MKASAQSRTPREGGRHERQREEEGEALVRAALTTCDSVGVFPWVGHVCAGVRGIRVAPSDGSSGARLGEGVIALLRVTEVTAIATAAVI